MKLHRTNLKIIDKYIIKQILFGLLIVSSILLGIAWFSQIIRLLSYLVNNNIGFWTFIRMTTLLLPDLLVIILPIALFAVVLFVYNRLVSDKELVIMQAVGMSVKELSKPALNIAIFITLMSFYVTLFISPIYAVKYRTFAFDAQNDISALLIQEGEFNEITKGLTIYVKGSKDNVLSDIFINDQRIPTKPRTILAERGIITASNNNISIALVNGSVQEESDGKYTFGSFEKYTADLGVVAKNSVRNKRAGELKFFEIIFARELGYANDETYPKFLVELHKRLIEPLYNIIFTLIALVAIFKSPLNKRSNSKNMIFAVFSMIGVEMLYIALLNLLRVNRHLYPLVYLITIGIIILLYKILYSEKTIKFKRIKWKK